MTGDKYNLAQLPVKFLATSVLKDLMTSGHVFMEYVVQLLVRQN